MRVMCVLNVFPTRIDKDKYAIGCYVPVSLIMGHFNYNCDYAVYRFLPSLMRQLFVILIFFIYTFHFL